jgi:hypothetical protein
MISFLLSFFKTKAQLQLEIVFLWKQLEILSRTDKKFKIRKRDRLFFTFMKRIFANWKSSLIIIKPGTVIKWHRKGFKLYWEWKCRNNGGRPKIPQEQINLIKRMSKENPFVPIQNLVRLQNNDFSLKTLFLFFLN